MEPGGEQVGCFVVCVEGVDDVLSSDRVAFDVIVGPIGVGGLTSGFLGYPVVKDGLAVLCIACFTASLELFWLLMFPLQRVS